MAAMYSSYPQLEQFDTDNASRDEMHKSNQQHKTGRKGDPRMHRAVAARLANPSLSLFEALKYGGFDYPNDDDASYVDSEQVTLAQRKNQLSRRLRLAKKVNNDDSSARSGVKRSLSDDDQDEVERHELMAKFHPEYHPIIVPRVGLGPLSQVQQQNAPKLNVSAPVGTVSFPYVNHPSETTSTPPSGVAIASLSSTAQSLGLSLEQLAVTLSSSSNLSRVLSNADSEKLKELALNLYQSECRNIYTKCMLLAGYSPSEAQEGSRRHAEFAYEAWQEEGKRIQRWLGPEEAPLETRASSCANESHEHEYGYYGQHVHRLEGKCGHKAVLHQPPDGTAHIDFVVGDKVECYQNLNPTGNNTAWPSSYKCQDLSCDNQCSSKFSQNAHHAKSSVKPKTYLLDDLDLQGSEWNTSFNDESVLGLFKLGDSQHDIVNAPSI